MRQRYRAFTPGRATAKGSSCHGLERFPIGNHLVQLGRVGLRLQALAQFAIREAEHAAVSILGEARDLEPQPFVPNMHGEFVSVGPGWGVGWMFGLNVSGRFAIVMKRITYIMYWVQVGSFRLATSGVRDETQIHTHLCYSEFGVVIDAIRNLDADVTSIEAARSRMEVIADIRTNGFDHGIGPGVGGGSRSVTASPVASVRSPGEAVDPG